MKTYEPKVGDTIIETARHIVALASETGEAVTANFSSVDLTANKGDTVKDVVKFFNKETGRCCALYCNSPEGNKLACEEEICVRRMQQQHDVLIQQLPSLDFSNDVLVLDFLCQFEEFSSHTDVLRQGVVVVGAFMAHGYHPNVNCGSGFNGADRENFKRWIIGQALFALAEGGAINQVIHRFTDAWKKRFIL